MEEVYGIDFTVCEICQKRMSLISTNHLRIHNITLDEYKIQFTTSVLSCEKLLKTRSENAKKSNAPRKGIPRSQEIKDKIALARVTKPKKKRKPLAPKTKEQREKISQRRKQYYKNNSHWNQGKRTPDEVRQRISQAHRLRHPVKEKCPSDTEIEIANLIDTLPPIFSKFKNSPSSGCKNRIIQLINHYNLLEQQYNAKLIDATPKGALIHYDIQCNHCKGIFSKTNQWLRPCKIEKTNKLGLCPYCNPREITVSQGELEILNFIKHHYKGIIETNNRTKLDRLELDIYLPELNLAIEYTGLYWHSEEIHNVKTNLHRKYTLAKKQGIQLLTIFEDEWLHKREMCKERILYKLHKSFTPKIHARKCKIDVITAIDKNTFLKQHHMFGNDICTISYGAFYNDELVAVMTFKPTSYVKGGTGDVIELNRFATKSNIPGIGSRLFKRYTTDHPSVKSIISYSDNRWNTGEFYKQLGFDYTNDTPPSYWYFKNNVLERIHRSRMMKHKLVEQGNDPSLTEYEIAKSLGFYRIWDCGNTKWTWTAIQKSVIGVSV